MHVFDDVKSQPAAGKRCYFGDFGGPVPPTWWFSASRQGPWLANNGQPTIKIAQPRIAKLGDRFAKLGDRAIAFVFATVPHPVRRRLPASLASRSDRPLPLDRLY